MPDFAHLHVHTQFSLLDGAANISDLMKKAQKDEMKAVAITDHGNMFGVFKFVAEANKHNIKPIVGCEFYLVNDRHKKTFTKEDKDIRCHQLLLAKNAEGYKNLAKLCSLGYIEGMYSKYPRIDKELILKYHKGLIATTCCIGAEVPRTILKKGEEEGEKVFKWWLDIFGDDYYVELQRHDIADQIKVNEVLVRFAKKYNVKIIASNDTHYVNQEDANAHDILLCINTGEKQSTPTNKEFNDEGAMPKGTRFAFYNDQFYFKTKNEMAKLFHDLPESLDNTIEIVDKVESLKLKRDILLPNFPIPDEFKIHQGSEGDVLNQWEYLKHLTFEGAKKRYVDITPEIEERLNFELFTIKTMGFAGYFLIVQDFINKGREIGVFVGPGRGSAAGSAVAYCIGITNIDPIKYDLLFERFLNPDRKSMPDIDTDFDDEGRQKVIDYVVDKYGKTQVAQIVTYGSMAAKMSIKDVARVLDLPLQDSNALAKLVPEKPGIELGRVLTAPLDGEGGLSSKEGINGEDLENVKKLREIYKGNDLQANVLKEALILEGSVRGTGVHAAGIIIAPHDLTDLMPVATSKDSDLLLTQYDGKVIEDAGVIKMDFLGLKTLTIIKDALALIKKNKGVDIEIDEIDLEDQKTFALYQRGETNGTFQFESPGMQKYLKELRPDKFADLIAMNALYRPGPLEYIPNYIRRKHGKEPITYDIAEMQQYLEDTYGITVYQEQVMLLSQKLANFSKGDADILRKAMGKKDRATLDKMKSKFMEGCEKNGHDPKVCDKVWTDWEAFASYAFNKSHSTCYAFVAFQTAFLKAHHPAEYMASVLTHNMSNIDKISFFMDECRKMGLTVLGPDINESSMNFDVNKEGKIRFGLGAIKGAGEAAIAAIISEREKNGPYTDIFNLAQRVNLRTMNKKTFECFAYAGAFDSFGLHRAQYFYVTADKDNSSTIEKIIRYGNAYQADQEASQHSLFGSTGSSAEVAKPKVPDCEPWSDIEKLKYEKEVVGFYISGHPLDQFRLEIEKFCTCTADKVFDYKNKEANIAGIVGKVNVRQMKNGKSFVVFTLEDFADSIEMALFGEDYLKFAHWIKPGEFLFIKGKVQQRFNNSEQWEFRPSTITLLADVRKKFLKGIMLSMEAAQIKNDILDRLESLIKDNPGDNELRFLLADHSENITVELFSRRFKIEPNNSFLEQLKQLEGVDYKILV
ncbi:MAG: DNA polymerase III subunit alpha [Cytophagaceae bacterium]